MVYIKPFIGLAAVFSVAFGAPSAVKRTNEKSPSSYGESYGSKSYDDSYKGSYEDKSYEDKSYDNSYDNKYEDKSEDKSYDNSYEDKSYEDKSYEDNTYEYETETRTAEYEKETRVYTKEYEATSTAAAEESYPTYGSGKSNWDTSGYDDCVSKCVADYGSKDTWYKPSPSPEPTSDEQSEGSSGNGATHTVIVAPRQGFLRFIPFAVNASVGDTIKFMWGANNHTVTKGSELLPCNKSADALFTSGPKDKDFVFTQVVNTTEPTFYFCNTPGHCQKGMFGIINPRSDQNAPTSASLLMSDLKAENTDLKAYAAVVDKSTVNNEFARNWGSNILIGDMPDWAKPLAAENILFTRSVLAANPDVSKDGTIDLSVLDKNPLMVPDDVSVALANAGSPAPEVTGAVNTPPPSPSDASSAAAAETPAPTNSAMSVASPRVLVALTVIIATFLAL
jgi:plastocyanin